MMSFEMLLSFVFGLFFGLIRKREKGYTRLLTKVIMSLILLLSIHCFNCADV